MSQNIRRGPTSCQKWDMFTVSVGAWRVQVAAAVGLRPEGSTWAMVPATALELLSWRQLAPVRNPLLQPLHHLLCGPQVRPPPAPQ